MKCDLCGNNNAKYKYYEVNADSIEELNICEECARKKGIDFSYRSNQDISESMECPNCGLTFKDFKEDNRLGCPECYNAFRKKIMIILRQLHPGVEYRGKKPVNDTRVLNVKKEIRQLQEKLQNFVEKEKFEEAVKLRDKIEEYEEELNTLREKK